MANNEIYRVEIPIIVDDQTEGPLRQAEERVSRFQRTAEKRTKMVQEHMGRLARIKIEPMMQVKDKLTERVLKADRLIKKLGMEKASPLIEAQDRVSAVVTRIDAALKAVDRGDVKVLAEMQGPLMDEIVKAKSALSVLNDVRAGPVAELRGELFGQLTRAFTEAKKLDQLMVEPRATLRERVTWKVREIGTGLRQLTSKAWTVTIEAKDKVVGVAKRIGGVLTSPLAAVGLVGGGIGLGALVKDFIMTAGRTETLNIAMNAVAKSTGTSMDALLKQRKAVMDLGIAEQEATLVMTRFMQGQLNIAEAAKVARVAQDAAVIAGVNSSEATQTIVEAIAKLSPELLTAFGMTRNLNDIYADYADRIGIVVKTKDKYGKTVRHLTRDMTEAEKKQAMLNYVLEEGAKIAGTYEMSMDSAFKKMGSLARYWTDFKTKVGAPLFLAAFGSVIDGLTDAFKSGIKWAERNQKALEQWGKKVAGVFDRATARIKSVLGSTEFQNARFSEKFQMLIEAGLDDVITWLDGPGKEKLASVFVTLGETSVKAYIAGMRALGSKSIEELKEGNIKGAAIPAGLMYLLGGGAIARGAWGLWKRLYPAGKGAMTGLDKFMATRAASRAAMLEATNPLAAQILRGTYASAASTTVTTAAQTTQAASRAAQTTQAVRAAQTNATTKSIATVDRLVKPLGNIVRRVALPLAVGLEAYNVYKSDDKIKAATQGATGLISATAGAKMGAALGTVLLPGIGTIIGGFLGAGGGYIAGRFLGGKAVDVVRGPSVAEAAQQRIEGAEMQHYLNQEIYEPFREHVNRAESWGRNLIGNFMRGRDSAGMSMGGWLNTKVYEPFRSMVNRATSWGRNLMGNFNSGMRSVPISVPVVPTLPGITMGGIPLKKYAIGGILSRPHLGMVAEAGPEAIIPLSTGMRSRAMGLWAETGRRLGVAPYAEGGFAGSIPLTAPAMAGAIVNLNFDLAGLVGQVVIENREDIDGAVDKITGAIANNLHKVFQNMTK